MRQAAARGGEAMEQETRIDQRRVERLAVVGDEDAGRSHERGSLFEQRPFGGKAGEHELPHPKHPTVEPPASHEKCIRACAAGQAGRFEIQKQERPARSVGDRRRKQQLQSRPPPVAGGKAISHRDTAKAVTGVIGAIDDEIPVAATLTPLTAENIGNVVLTGDMRLAFLIR